MERGREYDKLIAEVYKPLLNYAMSLCKNKTKAEDLRCEVLCVLLEKNAYFEEGTNFKAWSMTIMRNLFLTEMRKKKREAEDPDGVMASKLVGPEDEQEWKVSYKETIGLMRLMPIHQRNALLLAADGVSLEEIALMFNVPVGTIKSRVSRGRDFIETGKNEFLDGRIVRKNLKAQDNPAMVDRLRLLYFEGKTVSELALICNKPRLEVMTLLSRQKIKKRQLVSQMGQEQEEENEDRYDDYDEDDIAA